MPGFETGGLDLPELGDGLNLIIGPNASGKTTTCRAIRGLLWPETLKGVSPVSLAGRWVEDGHVLQLQVEGTERTCELDGVAAEPPPLPAAHLASCFTITVDDLFTDTETDSDLAGNVAREMAGGYDLGAIRQLDLLKLRRGHGRTERDALNNARQHAKAIEAEHERLQSREDELADLETREREAQNASAHRGRLIDVIELIGLRDQIGQGEKALEAFPENIDRLRGNEAESLKEIRDDLDNSTEALEGAIASAETARRQLEEASLPEGGIPDVRLEEQKLHLERLREDERNLRDARKHLDEIDRNVQSSLQALGAVSDRERLDDIDVAGLDDIEAFHRQAEDSRSRKSAIESRLNALAQEEPPGDVDPLINGIRILQDWFEAGPAGAGVSPKNRILALAPTLLTAGIAVALGVLVSPWWLVLLPAAAIAGALAWSTGRPSSTDRRRISRDSYERLPLDPPSAWDSEAVGERLGALQQSLAQERHRKEQETEREACDRQLAQLEREAEDLIARRGELIERFGLAPDTSNLALVVLAGNLRTYREASAVHRACGDEVARCLQELEGHLDTVNAFLVEFGEEACESHDQAAPRSQAVFKRATLHREAGRQLAGAEPDAASAKERVSTLQKRKTQLFEEIRLGEDDDAELENRLEQLSEYRDATQSLNGLKVREAHLSEKLDDAPELKDLSLEAATAEAARLETLADGYKTLVERITEIHSQVDQASRATRLEDALASVDRAGGMLAERRGEAELAAAGNFLLGRVESEHKVESQPEVFRQASRWFSLFTRGRYELRIDDAPGPGSAEFRALDTSGGNGLALDELSRGTRMHLLLAVRLAFAAAAERGTRLPFILDEVLNSTDPIRYRAIAECLLELVRDGRQVFYLTCQPGDAAGWREIAEEMGITDTLRLDLADIRRLQQAASGPLDDSTVDRSPVPAPGDMTLSEYQMSLNVPGLDPAAGARANHVAYFLESPEQLYRLVRAGIETYGQLQSIGAHGNIDAYVPDDVLGRMEAMACILDAFSEARGIGRGRPVSREALIEAGVSKSFIDRVTQIAEDLNWDAKRLVEALDTGTDERAKRFHKKSLTSLEENLSERGYLDTRETLDKETAYNRVLAAGNDFVKRGAIDTAEVREQFIRFWGLCVSTGQT
jgi:hypothetical protein